MQRSTRTTARVRAQAVGLTLLAHGIVVWLLVELERRSPHRSDAPALQYVSIWPELPSERQPSEEPAAPAKHRKPPVPARAPASTAIQFPEESPTPQAIDPPSRNGVDGPTAPPWPADWKAAATAAAKRFAEGNGASETFSPPPQPQRKPCKPGKFDAQTEDLMAQRLPPPPDPEPVGADPKANCIVVGGYPKCVRKMTFRLRKRATLSTDLLAETVAGKPPVPSVPSTDQCD
jgi:hypothetical protein